MLHKLQNTSLISGVFFCIFLIAIDFVIKYMIVHSDLTYFCNNGVALSIQLPVFLMIMLWIIFVIGFSVHIYKERSRSLRTLLPSFLILAGAIGNAIDRFLYSCVIDYIHFFSLSVFNFADILITIGAILLVWDLFHEKNDHST